MTNSHTWTPMPIEQQIQGYWRMKMTKQEAKDKLRQAFETEYKVIPKLPLEKLPSGRYKHGEVEEAWQWFQAGFEASNDVNSYNKG